MSSRNRGVTEVFLVPVGNDMSLPLEVFLPPCEALEIPTIFQPFCLILYEG